MKKFAQFARGGGGQYGYGALVEEEDSKKSTAAPSSQSSSSRPVNTVNKDRGGDGERSCLADTGKNSNKWYNTPSVSGTFGKR